MSVVMSRETDNEAADFALVKRRELLFR